MSDLARMVLKEIGLDRWPPLSKDKAFWLALFAGAVVWFVIYLTVAPTFSVENRSIAGILLTSIVYYPVLEEILFRGIFQGQLLKLSWGRKKFLYFSAANWVVSLLFMATHFWYQPILWALMIVAPSLVYGYFRDRYSSIYPSIILHAFYNGGFVLINLIAN